MNLAVKCGQTDGYTAKRFVEVVQNYIAPVEIDKVIMNSAQPIAELSEKYQEAGEPLIIDDLKNDERVLRLPLISDYLTQNVRGDKLKRSLVRHDPIKLASAILIASGIEYYAIKTEENQKSFDLP